MLMPKNNLDKSHRFECASVLIKTNTLNQLRYKRVVQIEDRMDRYLGLREK